MAHILHLQHTPRWTFERVNATIRAIGRTVLTERSLALRAATKATSPRQCVAEVRAMYALRLDPPQESDAIARPSSLERI